jgi:hypothetical protein
MAIFQLEIADADVDRVLNAVAVNYRRPETVPNPEYVLVEVLDADGNPVLDDAGNPTYSDPVDENGNPIPSRIDNPESKGDFTHRMVREFLASHVSSHELEVAKAEALANLNSNVDLSDPNP